MILVKRLSLFLIGVAVCSTSARAQSDSLLTHVLLDSATLFNVNSEFAQVAQKPPIGSIRLASSSGGFMFGMLVGGFTGYEMVSQNCDHCRNPTGDALVVGGVIGGALGAALGAAFLDLKSVCSFDKRIMRTLIGSAAGASALFVAAGGMEHRRGRSAFFVPIGAIGGSMAMLGRCWKSRY
jgi:amino acid transporter